MFIYPIHNHNWRNISTIYIYITRLALREIFSPSNKIHQEVGRAKDLSAPRYYFLFLIEISTFQVPVFHSVLLSELKVSLNILIFS